MKKLLSISILAISILGLCSCSIVDNAKEELSNKWEEKKEEMVSELDEQKENFKNIVENIDDFVEIGSLIENSEVTLVSSYFLENGNKLMIFDVGLREETIYDINLLYQNEQKATLIGCTDDKTHYLFAIETDSEFSTVHVQATYPGLTQGLAEKTYEKMDFQDKYYNYLTENNSIISMLKEMDIPFKENKYGIINIDNNMYFLGKGDNDDVILNNNGKLIIPAYYKITNLTDSSIFNEKNINLVIDDSLDVEVNIIIHDDSLLMMNKLKSWESYIGFEINTLNKKEAQEIFERIKENGKLYFECEESLDILYEIKG